MFDVTLICMGKLKEKFYVGAAQEYEKRLSAYCRFRLLELPEFKLPEDPSPAQIAAGLDKEAEQILTKIPKGAWLCIWTPEGKMLSPQNSARTGLSSPAAKTSRMPPRRANWPGPSTASHRV